jgi:hypothetical protein
VVVSFSGASRRREVTELTDAHEHDHEYDYDYGLPDEVVVVSATLYREAPHHWQMLGDSSQ